MKIFTAIFFYILILLMALMPFFLMYLFSDLLAFLLCRVFKYRKKVIIRNLKACFPHKNDAEIESMLPSIYRNLTDNILEGIKAFSMSKRQIIRRHKIVNPELIEEYYNQGKSIIAVTGHYNNWEWGSLSASLQTHYKVVALYKPLSNQYIDSFVRWTRERCGTFLASIQNTSNTFKKFKDIPTTYLMAADQSPGRKYLKKAYWINFMGVETAFLHGPEKYAVTNDYAVLYVDIQRVKRGFYEIELCNLKDNPKETKDGEITALFAQKLESVILKDPSNWLWSHNRWKLKR